jgi:N-dimethylarginine dimethylaminohydrolase
MLLLSGSSSPSSTASSFPPARSHSTTVAQHDSDDHPPRPPPPPAPTHAIVRAVSQAFRDAITSSSSSSSSSSSQTAAAAIDVDAARQQHARYASALCAAHPSLNLIELDAPDDLPDACFVEDTLVVLPGSWLSPGRRRRGLAVVTRPAAASRARETDGVLRALQEDERLRETVEVVGQIASAGPDAALDGGDVLILPPAPAEEAAATQPRQQQKSPLTVLVGITGRTNALGAARLRDLLRPHGVQVVAVPVAAALGRLAGLAPGGAAAAEAAAAPTAAAFHPLHLKSAVTALSHDVLLCADGPAGRAVAAAVHGALLRARAEAQAASSGGEAPAGAILLPTFAFVPEEDACAANVVLLGDAVVAQPRTEASRVVLEHLCAALGRRLVMVSPPLEEMKKADGALTCCSVLI